MCLGENDISSGRARPLARRLATAALAALIAVSAPGCGADTDPTPPPDVTPPPSGDGYVDSSWYRARQREYLEFATQALRPQNILNVIAHIERSRVDSDYSVEAGAVAADAWDPLLDDLKNLEDGRDFIGLYLLHILLDYRDHDMLAPGLVERVEEAMLGFKFWYTEPTPDGLTDRSFYWSENHIIVYHAIEYLMGQTYPDQVFTNDGRSGAEHREHARERILAWLTLRMRTGFGEWHSNVYYQKDILPLLALAEFAADEAVQIRAAIVLDVLLFDLALHTQQAAFGATRGRSYKKNKMSSLDEDTWHISKLLFDTTTEAYQSTSDAGGALFARAENYRLPEAIRQVARTERVFVDRERMGLDIATAGPYSAAPVAPLGLAYDDPEQLSLWWGAGAYAAWPVVPLTIDTLNRYNLWDSPFFAQLAGIRSLADDPVSAQQLAITLAPMLNAGLLGQVNTYTWRSPEVMLSTAVDVRKGAAAAQAHAWQATFDPNALVFTNHPFRPLASSGEWLDDPESGGYWNGEASMPRSAQHENVAIHIYAPQYPAENSAPLDFFRYEPYTHAYVPQDHFDEVVVDDSGQWVFGRRGQGFFGLYSYRPVAFRDYDRAIYDTNGLELPFDLIAEGGADNVWIIECGQHAEWGSFEDFQAALTAAQVLVSERGARQPNGVSPGFDVIYNSPSQGVMRFGWEAPFTVRGDDIPTTDFPRFDNPFAQSEYDSRALTISIDGYQLDLDLSTATREAGVATSTAP
ncbi:MAG: hypothetical protein Tsb0020_45380 [Haliangiales bacterium]